MVRLAGTSVKSRQDYRQPQSVLAGNSALNSFAAGALMFCVTPAMAAGVTDTLRDMVWIVSLIDARALKPGPRGSYKKGSAN